MDICEYCGQELCKRVDQSLILREGDKSFCDEYCNGNYELYGSMFEITIDGIVFIEEDID